MDKTVLDAMARWPNVPDVYGWLSLNEHGHWRLHPLGDALRADAATGTIPMGEAITSPPILQFISRNYACDAQGQWFFQNGPQRVYVRLDAAPFILHTAGNHGSNSGGAPPLRTQNGLDAGRVRRWLLASDGRLYADADAGPGLIEGRDLEAVLDRLRTPDGAALLDTLDGDTSHATRIMILSQDAAGVEPTACPAIARNVPPSAPGLTAQGGAKQGAVRVPLDFCPADDVPAQLGFVRYPRPPAS
ncbi:DUF2946 family protein [Pusillimonas sp. TS35]|uniref:DUF2946 family protein n=1 Tax=Paracandidimonas lactea TaxID=2895524 RepID=UPI0013685FF0|nr:DUF2946 family protein [Paracandidimonas lactea]MYN14531.1 DUF2946 family protein [Pusillimonas sp. TS35]